MSQPGSSTQSARYRVLETLGQGGMGVVYRMHDLVHDGSALAWSRSRSQTAILVRSPRS